MSGPLESKPSISDYRAAVDRLEAAREAAHLERARVELTGDVAAGEKNIDGLKIALDEFKGIRSRLSPQDLFVVEFNVEIAKPCGVSLVRPAGMSWLEYFERAQDISRTVYRRESVYQGLIDIWRDKNFEECLRKSPTSLRVEMELCLEGSVGLQCGEQDVALQRRGLELPPGIHVMAGLVAFTIATGEHVTGDPQGPFVRVVDGYVMSAGPLGVYLSPALDGDWEDAKIGVAGARSRDKVSD
jgi:hypothetical protein